MDGPARRRRPGHLFWLHLLRPKGDSRHGNDDRRVGGRMPLRILLRIAIATVGAHTLATHGGDLTLQRTAWIRAANGRLRAARHMGKLDSRHTGQKNFIALEQEKELNRQKMAEAQARYLESVGS